MTDQTTYQPILPPEFAHMKVDTLDPRYKAAETFARENGLTQAQFTGLLAVEARGVAARHAAAKAASTQAAKPYSQMSFAEKLALADARRAAK